MSKFVNRAKKCYNTNRHLDKCFLGCLLNSLNGVTLMAKYVRTRFWTSTDACEVIELVEKRLKTKPAKDSINQDLCWLNATIQQNPGIEWVVVLKTAPAEYRQVVSRKNFKAYLVRHWEKTVSPERMVWMLYIIPR